MNENKGDIREIGYIDDNGQPQEWCFDCKGKIPALTILDNEMLYAGYTVDELREISSTRH